MTYFKEEKVSLIPFEEEHVAISREWNNDEEMTKYMCGRFPVSRYEQDIWYENLIKDKTKEKLIIIVEGKEVGMVSLLGIDHRNMKVEIGVYVILEEQKKGYAKKAVSMVVNFAFKELNMNKIYAIVQSKNDVSKGLFTSVGFKFESIDVSSKYSNGEFIDECKYVIFREDFIE